MRGENSMEAFVKLLAALALFLAAVAAPLEWSPLLFAALLIWGAYERVPFLPFFISSIAFVAFIMLFNFYAFNDPARGALNSVRAVTLFLPFYVYAASCSPHEIVRSLSRIKFPSSLSFMLAISSHTPGYWGRRRARCASRSRAAAARESGRSRCRCCISLSSAPARFRFRWKAGDSACRNNIINLSRHSEIEVCS